MAGSSTLALLAGVALATLSGTAGAQDATWLSNPGSSDYNTGTNWNTGTVPGQNDIAFFGPSSETDLRFSDNFLVGGWTFHAGAPDYDFILGTPDASGGHIFRFLGRGIATNGSDVTITTHGPTDVMFSSGHLTFHGSSTADDATFHNHGEIWFTDNSTADHSHITVDIGLETTHPNPTGGRLHFYNTSTAANATIVVNAGGLSFRQDSTAANALITNNSVIEFWNSSTASNALITNNNALNFLSESTAGGAEIINSQNGTIRLLNNSTAGDSEITNSGLLIFDSDSSSVGVTATAGNATIVNNSGGIVRFRNAATPADAQFTNLAGGLVDVSHLTNPLDGGQASINSISGDGDIYLGTGVLVLGGDNRDAAIGGVISRCGPTGNECDSPAHPDWGGGALVKVGTGTLTLSGASTYTGSTEHSNYQGATTIDAGTLSVTGSLVSAVQVNSGGTLGGTGSVGAVTVADGGILAPGASPGTITMASLVLNGGSILDFELGAPGVVGSGVNDLIVVTGGLTLDGTLDVTALPDFGNGLYTLIQYGTLDADNGLDLGATPVGFSYSLDSGAGSNSAVTLTVAGGVAGANQFWDGSNMAANGAVDGGTGVWNAADTNWTSQAGDANSAWAGEFAIFSGAAGAVTVEGQQAFTGMQFLTTGYRIDAGAGGGLVTDTAATNIRIGAGIAAEISAPISGTGGLVKQEAGALTLSGASSYGGGTQVLGGHLFVESNSALGTGAVVVDGAGSRLYFGNATPGIDAGTLTITNRNQGATSFQAGSSAGNATITSGTGSWVSFIGDSTAGDATLIGNGGSTQFWNNATAGNATISSNINGSIRFFGASSAGNAEIANNGLLRFEDSSSAGGAEIATNLTLVFANNSTAGDAAITNTRTLVFDGNSTAGNAGITNTDGLTFLGASTVGTATIVNDGNLFFSQTGDDSYAGGIGGAGDVFKTGAGTLTLSGANTYTGATTVSGGTLNIAASGSLVSAVTVDTGGRLAGIGTIGGLTLNSGGTLSPGNSIGAMTVAGDATFNAGSVFAVEVEAPDQADLLSVTGTATIDGGAVQISKLSAETSYQDGQTYRLIEAGTVVRNGGFTLNQPFLFLTAELVYGAGFVDLLLKAGGPGGDFTTIAQTYNQRQAATGLNGLEQGGDALAVHNELLLLTDPSQARRAFDLASGEIHASGQHVIGQSFGLFTHTLRGQASAGIAAGGTGGTGGRVFTAPLAYGPASPAGPGEASAHADARVRQAWLAPLGGGGTVGGDGNAGALDWWTAGLAGGYEALLEAASGQAFAGFGLGYLRSHGAVPARLSTMNADGFNIGAYGGWSDGPWSLAGSFAYAANRVSTTRRIVFGGIDRTAEASYWSHSIGFSGEAAYAFALGGGTTVSPLATLDAGWSGHGGFTETGAGALSLTGAAQGWTRLDTGLGFAVRHVMPTGSGKVTFDGRVLWEHAFADVVPSQNLSFAGSPTGFTVRGPDAGRDRLRLGLGVAFEAAKDMTIRANYTGLFSGNQQSHGASLGLNVRF